MSGHGPMTSVLEIAAAWLLAFLWAAPLLYAIWAAFHPMDFVSRFDLLAPLTLDNFPRPGTWRPLRGISSTPSCWSA